MNKAQADELASYVTNDRGRNAAIVRRLGNGEHVCIMKANTYHLWSFADYLVFNQQEETKNQQKKEQRCAVAV